MSDSTPSPITTHPEYDSVVNHPSLLVQENKELREENARLKHDLKLFRKALFGSKSERFVEGPNAYQAKLFETDLKLRPKVEEAGEIEVKSHKRRRRKRHKDSEGNLSHFPGHLPRENVTLEPDEVGVCKSCGKDKVRLSEKVTEKLCEVPAKYFVKRFIRPVYGCRCGNCSPVEAKAPYGALPKSILEESFLGAMLCKKFAWHLPFYRQSQMLRELGIELSRDILILAANKLGQAFTPIVDAMLAEIRASDLVQMDETPVVVAKRNAKGKAKYSKPYCFWPVLADGQVVFIYTGNRKHSNVADILGDDFKGILQSDGYEAYASYCRAHPEASLALCWDHARRKFDKIKDIEHTLALEALSQLKELYRVEREIKKLVAEEKLTPDKIPKYRKKHALPILLEFKKWCETVRDAPEVLPKSDLMDACSYPLNHWEGLTLYLNHGNVPISNVKVEQQIRNLKLGAKNWLHAASEVGAHTIAVMNSLVCTCKMNGINVLEYFTDVLRRLDSDTAKNLTPLNWAKNRKASNA